MKTYVPGLIVVCMLTGSSWASPQSNTSASQTASGSQNSDAAMSQDTVSLNKINKAETEAREAKALAEKVIEETKLQEALLKQKMVEAIFKAELEAGLILKAAKRAEAEAQLAAASAAKSEALLRDIKAKLELKTWEQAGPIQCDLKVTAAKYEKLESELKLNKLQQEIQHMMPASTTK